MKYRVVPYIFVLVGGIVGPSAGAQTFYTSHTAFESAIANLPTTFESFEDYADESSSPNRTVFYNHFSVQFTNALEAGVHSSPLAGTYATNGTKFLHFELYNSANSVEIVFNTPVQAFGLDITDAEIQALQYSLSTGNSGIAALPLGDASKQFFGFTSSAAITSIKFFGTNFQGTDSDRYGFDSILAAPVPEPDSLLLFAAGVLVLGAAKCRAKA